MSVRRAVRWALAAAIVALIVVFLWPRSSPEPVEADPGGTNDHENPPAQAIDRPAHAKNTSRDSDSHEPSDARADEPSPPSHEPNAGDAPTEATHATERRAARSAPAADASDTPAQHAGVAAMKPSDILAGINSARPGITQCYHDALAKGDTLAGRILVKFTIVTRDDGGVVQDADVADTDLDAPFFQQCVLQRVVGITFPAPMGDPGAVLEVNFPSTFDPGGGFGEQNPAGVGKIEGASAPP